MSDLRSKNNSIKYKELLKNLGDDVKDELVKKDSIKEWEHWRLVENDYPYDLIASKHTMIIPKRVFGSLIEANCLELAEIAEIKIELANQYNLYIESTPGTQRSIKAHYHLHCIKLKDKICE